MTPSVERDDARPSLALLPSDILITVMTFLDPLDLIALRNTCRVLYDVSHQRIVWIKALESLCASNNVFLPTFQLGQMSTASLTRAATTPVRWLGFLRRMHHQQVWDPNQTDKIERGLLPPPKRRCIKLLPNEDELQKLFLVPGGRFVVVLTLRSLHLWDLERVRVVEEGSGMMSGTEQPSASVTMCQQYNLTFSAQPTENGTGIRVVVISYPIPSNLKRKLVVVYEIWPLSARPEFIEIARLGVGSIAAPFSYRLAGDRLVLLDANVLKVWDFVRDQWAEWDTQNHFYNPIFVTSDAVVLLNHQETLVWRIPKLVPLDQEPVASFGNNIFSFPSLLVFGGEAMKYAYWGTLDDWYWGTQEDFLDLFTTEKSRGALTLSRYALTPPPSTPGSATALSHPIAPSLLFRRDLNPTARYCSLQYRYSEGELLACTITADFECARLTVLGKEPNDFMHIVMKVNHDSSIILDYSVCPVAARMCYATDENEIEVVDLLRAC